MALFPEGYSSFLSSSPMGTMMTALGVPSSSGEVSAARKTGAGKPRTAARQNGQKEPHYHRKGASATCG